MVFLFRLNNGDATICKVQNMQTNQTVCMWREKYDTAYNQATNTCLLQKRVVSKQAAQAVTKHTDVSTTTMETTVTQGLVVCYGTSAPAHSKIHYVLCKQNITHLTVREKSGPKLSIKTTA